MDESDDDFTAIIKVNKHFNDQFGTKRKLDDRELSWLNDRKSSTNLDFTNLKANYTQLELKYKCLETQLKDNKLKYEREIEEKAKESQLGKAQISELKHQMTSLISKYETLKEVNESMKKEKSSLKKQLVEIESNKYSDSIKLQLELENSKQEVLTLKNTMQLELEASKRKWNEAQEEKVAMTTQLNDLQKKLSEAMGLESQLEDTKYQLNVMSQRNKDYELERSRNEEATMKGKMMKMKLDTLEKLEAENKAMHKELAYLKTMQTNADLLMEKYKGLQEKLERTKARCLSLEEVQLENEALKKKLQEFDKLVQPMPGVKNANDIVETIMELTHSNDKYVAMYADMKKEQHRMEEENHSMKNELGSLMKEHNALRLDSAQLKKLRTRLQLVTKERDSYKNILDSYERDLTISSTPSSHPHNKNNNCNNNISLQQLHSNATISSLTQRLRSVEDICNVYKNQHKQNDAEICRHLEQIAKLNNKIVELQQELDDDRRRMSRKIVVVSSADVDGGDGAAGVVGSLKKTIEELQTKLRDTEVKCERLECAIDANDMRGVYNPGKTQAISMKVNNPYLSSRQNIVRQLELREEEVQHLKIKLKTLTESREKEDLTVRTNQMIASIGSVKEQEELKSQLQNVELINKRLTENYEKISQSLRTLVSTVLGYKYEKMGDNLYKLSSIFAESDGEFFLIEQLPDGEFDLMGNQYSQSFPDLIETHLKGPNALPPFMSAVTLMLHSKVNEDFTLS